MIINEKAEKIHKIATFFWLVLIGCTIGWIYEMIFYRIDLGHFIKRGQGFGPWLPIYGVGTVSLLIIISIRKFNAVVFFFIAAIGGGIIELVSGWLFYTFGNGLRLWDYNVEIWSFGNIGGYVCLRSVLIFGVFGLLLYKFLLPLVKKMVDKTPVRLCLCLSIPVAGLFFADIVYGYFIKRFI